MASIKWEMIEAESRTKCGCGSCFVLKLSTPFINPGLTIIIAPSSKNPPRTKVNFNIEVKVLSLWNQYYSNDNPSKLSGTDMILMDEHSCNDDGINFISFNDFVEAKIDQSYSFDVIGRLIQNKDITVLNPNNAPKHILEFQLQDVTGTIIPCILWNDLAIKQTLCTSYADY
ncbi:oxoglutarate/iron-dependent dioxygenase [Tanacetum coccineum]